MAALQTNSGGSRWHVWDGIDTTGANEAETWRLRFTQGAAGQVGWPCRTNLVADIPTQDTHQVAMSQATINGTSWVPFPKPYAPTVAPQPMRMSDVLRVYESQLLQIQDRLIGSP